MAAYKTPNFEPTGKWHTEWWSFRHCDRRREISFVHSAALVDPRGNIVARANIGYCNRTWEAYSGDSVRRRLSDVIERKCSFSPEEYAEVKPLIDQLKVSQPVSAVSCDAGTRIGYSLSMCCPM